MTKAEQSNAQLLVISLGEVQFKYKPINYFLIVIPETSFANAMGNSIGGLLSGFMGGFIGLLIYLRQSSKFKHI